MLMNPSSCTAVPGIMSGSARVREILSPGPSRSCFMPTRVPSAPFGQDRDLRFTSVTVGLKKASPV